MGSGETPMCTKETSLPQMPHAATRTTASRGPGRARRSRRGGRRWARARGLLHRAPLPEAGGVLCSFTGPDPRMRPAAALDRRGPAERGSLGSRRTASLTGRAASRGIRTPRRASAAIRREMKGDRIAALCRQSAPSRSEPVRRQLCIFLERDDFLTWTFGLRSRKTQLAHSSGSARREIAALNWVPWPKRVQST